MTQPSGTLMLHCGARGVPREYLATVPTPPPARRWYPIGHDQFVSSVHEALASQGFTAVRERYGLSKGDSKLFGVLDLAVDITDGVSLVVGIRNSINQTFPLGFCAGQRVFVCDNMAMSAELMAKRKHSLNGLRTFRSDIAECVSRLPEFARLERLRIERMQQAEISDERAESLLLRAYERGILSHRLLPTALRQWRQPEYEAFLPRTAWSLFNACTFALMDRAKSNPAVHARQTMALQALLAPRGADSPDLLLPAPSDGATA